MLLQPVLLPWYEPTVVELGQREVQHISVQSLYTYVPFSAARHSQVHFAGQAKVEEPGQDGGHEKTRRDDRHGRVLLEKRQHRTRRGENQTDTLGESLL